MKTSIVLTLENHPKKDGTCPILLRIIHYGKAAQISTGISVKKADWNEHERKIKPSYRGTESVARLNNFLQKRKAEAIDTLTKLSERKVLDSMSLAEIKSALESSHGSVSFLDYGHNMANRFEEEKRLGNARSYRGTLSIVKKANGEKDISFSEVNFQFLSKLEHLHLKKGKALNGLAVYMRTIRAIYNHAIKNGVVEAELYPFKKYEIKTTKTRKRAIGMEAIAKIQSIELDPSTALFDARNYFMASFYLRGMSFTDLAHLKCSDIIDGRIYYDRQKTHKPYNIKITDEMQALLDYYAKGKKKDEFIFPIIRKKGEKEQYVEVQEARKRFNKRLKKIATLCGIQENLTSYVSRHSFATRAKNLGVPIASISDMFGHADTKTTEVYLDSLPSEIIDDLHEKIVKQ